MSQITISEDLRQLFAANPRATVSELLDQVRAAAGNRRLERELQLLLIKQGGHRRAAEFLPTS